MKFSRISQHVDREQLRLAHRARGRRAHVPDLQPACARAGGLRRRRTPSVLDEDPPRESASPRGRAVREGGRRRGARAVGSEKRGAEGDLVRARTRAVTGFHRRAGRRRSRRNARRHRKARRRPEQGEPAAAGRTGDRSLGAGRLLRPPGRVSAERRARVLAQQGTLLVSALGPERLPQLPGRAAGHGHRSPGESRVSRAGHHVGRHGRRDVRLSRHARRHGLAHDDGEWSWRRGLGRRWHRSRSRDARPADFDADSAGARIPPGGRNARRRDGDRSRADGHRAAPQARRRRQVRRVLRPRPRAPDDCGSRDARQHVSRVRRHDCDLPDRRDDAGLPATHRPRRVARGARGRVREGAGIVPARGPAGFGLFRDDRSRSRDRGAESRGTEAAAGSRLAQTGEERLSVGAHVDDGGLASIDQVERRGRRIGACIGDHERRRRRGGGRCAGDRDGAGSRLGGDRRNHELHEHVEPERDDRRRSRREKGGGARPEASTVGEDEPCSGIEGGDRVLAQVGAAAVSRRARIQSRRLRVHDVHREQRAVARRRLRRSGCPESRRRLSAERQPQLRGTHSAAGARELSRVAAAGRGVRAGRPHDARSHDGADRNRQGRGAGLPARFVAHRARDPGDDAQRSHLRHVPPAIRRRVHRR